jgi:hypothetical protein
MAVSDPLETGDAFGPASLAGLEHVESGAV